MSEKLTAAQAQLVAALDHAEWRRSPGGTKSATILSLVEKKIIKGRGHPSYGCASLYMTYNSNGWQWLLLAARSANKGKK